VQKCHLYLSKVRHEVLAGEEVASLYSMRGEVELGFRELKASCASDKSRTDHPDTDETLIRSSVSTLTATRRLQTLIRRRANPELRARYTQLQFAAHFRRGAQCVFACLLEHFGFEQAEQSSHRGMNPHLVVEAIDPHVNRQRSREVWSR
jgi:hypothetical protein